MTSFAVKSQKSKKSPNFKSSVELLRELRSLYKMDQM